MPALRCRYDHEASTCPEGRPRPQRGPTNNDLQKLDELLIEKGAKLDTLAKEFDTSDVVSNIKNLAFCIPNTDCATDSTFEAKKAKFLQDIQNLQSELDLTPILQERTRLKQAFGNWQDANTGKEATWQGEVDAFFRCFDDKLKAVFGTSKTLKAQLDKLSDGLKKLSRTLDDTYVLPLYRNAKVTTDVVCSDKDSKALAGAPTDPKTATATTPPVPIEINYQNPTALAGSAGVVISTLGQHVVGIQNRNIPNGPNGFTTFFAVTAHQPVQFIPFSLAHLFLYGTRTNNISFSGGVGINTYNSST
jgi:hypothetical protein